MLHLDDNFLTTLPQEWTKLQNLKTLHLRNNDFEVVPEVIFELPRLASIHIGGSKGQFTQESFKKEHKFHVHLHGQAPDQIIPGLWLGSAQSARNRHLLQRNKISHVLTIMEDPQSLYPHAFTYLFLKAQDVDVQSISEYFNQSNEFIEKGRKAGGVLVHCAMGISRSASLVIAYLIQSQKLDANSAHNLCKEKREIIFPNKGFRLQLEEYASSLGYTGGEDDAAKRDKENCVIS